MDAIRICPEDFHGDERLKHHGSSYVISQYVAMTEKQIGIPTPDLVRRIDQIDATSRTIVVYEGANARDPESFFNEHAHAADWFRPLNVLRKRVWVGITRDTQPDQHFSERAHYLFADGHVQTIPMFLLRQWADEGYNFARPSAADVNR